MQAYSVGAEAKLVETLGDLHGDAEGWHAVHFAFSELLEEYRSEYQIKIALNMMQDMLTGEEGDVFLCEDGTVFLLCHGTTRQALNKVVFQLRYLFMDDPLSYTHEGEENPDFCHIYDFTQDEEYNAFSALARRKMLGRGAPEASGAGRSAPSTSSGGGGLIEQVRRQMSSSSPIRFFNASSMVSIEKKILGADLMPVIRHQPVCAAIPDMMVRRVFDEVYINIAHLRKNLGLDVDLLSNRWLFKYLTEVLDRKVLTLIEDNPKTHLGTPVSLNLNIKTLMSDSFLEFDAALKPEVKVSIVIEIQVSDVFEDMRAFIMARNALKKLGYRVCLDGLTNLSFSQISRERLGFDLVKVQWNADNPTDLNSKENISIAKNIKACGANRVILTRCDNKKAVDYGQAMGISLFQGRYLDKLMNPLSSVEN